MEDKEVKITKKQMIVAGIIVFVAIILLASVFGGKKEEAKAPIVKVEEKLPVQEENKVQEQTEPQIEEEKAEQEAVQPTEKVAPIPAPEMAAPKDKNIPEATKEVIEVKPQNSVLTFETTTEKALNYQIFYTVEREVWYDASHVVEHQGEAGSHKYSIVIPSGKVYRIRIDFDSNPGKVTIKNVYLDGTQKADLNNFGGYAYNQIDSKTQNKDGSLTITSGEDDPYMEYLTPLLPE